MLVGLQDTRAIHVTALNLSLRYEGLLPSV